ncbi:MAG: hypothetical protein JSW58_04160 [Candidatus Latescibacterota bacterium]|nr:MAG: hypothetical protein JSW58_04160 [Candidatus Latescibacterota bacterium]
MKHFLAYVLMWSFVIAVPVFVPNAQGQVMGPSLDKKDLEFGYIYKWFERDFESRFLGQGRWSVGAFYLKYGTCRWATLSVEGGISTVHHEDFENIDYRRYTIGMGVTTLLYDTTRFGVGMAAHYSEIFDHDRSQHRLHKNTRNVTVAIQTETTFSFERATIRLWGGPAFVYDQSRQYPWHSHEPQRNETSGNFGFALGANTLVIDRISVFGHVVYADAFQPRLGAGIRF